MIYSNSRAVCRTFSLLTAFVLLLLVFDLRAQDYHDYGFERNTVIKVYNADENLLDLAWTGGLNASQFHSFDLNFNGINDLVIFDRHGNRLLTFLNNGSGSEFAYSFFPEYIDFFPEMEHWVQFIDFNGNGKKDIFTYTVGGIKVYQNVSDSVIKFEQITYPYLRSLYGNIQTNLHVTNVDYPAITDMDGDGDLDILTFWGLGTFLEKHTNKSMELFGHTDSLTYVKTDYCWGYFAESEESNTITLDTCLNFNRFMLPSGKQGYEDLRHVGSTLLMLDMTGDGRKDLILGDIDYPGLFLLKNEGTQDSAYIVDIDTLFPSNTRPVNLYSFPVANYLDLTNNGISDLVVSPFDPSLRRSNHHKSVWFYRNNGTNEVPDFEFQREDLFQHRMIDVGAGAAPVLADLDGDGLDDLFVSNFGYLDTCYYDQFYNLVCKYISRISYYKNTGSAWNPEFTLVDDDFANLSELGLKALYPAFGDIDNNGLPEMLLGSENGNVMLFVNQSGKNSEPDFVLIDENYQQVAVSAYSSPQLIDLNGNGLLDMVIGQENGKISYYENQGELSAPVFTKITDEFGKVNVTDPMFSYKGYSIPCFFRDRQNKLGLFVGSESGRIFYFRDIEENLEGEFTLAEEQLLLIREGIRTAPAVGFLSVSNYPDLIIGNYGGGLSYYQGTTPKPFGIDKPLIHQNNSFYVFPNPASSELNIFLEPDNFSASHLEVFDLTGRMIYSKKNLQTQRHTINVAHWKKGMYIIVVKSTSTDGKELMLREKIIIGH